MTFSHPSYAQKYKKPEICPQKLVANCISAQRGKRMEGAVTYKKKTKKNKEKKSNGRCIARQEDLRSDIVLNNYPSS